MKNYIFTFVFLLACVEGTAQDWRTKDMKLWSEGPLVEDDFSRINSPDSIVSAHFHWNYKSSYEKHKIGNLRFRTYKYDLYMDKSSSWYDPAKHSGDFKYFQTVFDIAELERRKMQNAINKEPSKYQEIAEYYNRSAETRIESLAQETGGGFDRTALDRYASEISGELSEYVEEPVQSPSFERKFGCGLSLGYVGECFTGKLSKGVAMSNNFNFSILFPFLRHWDASLDFTGGGGKLLQDNFYHDENLNYDWIRNERVNTVNFNFIGGYRVIDKDYIAFSPVAGLGFGELSQKTGIKKQSENYYSSSFVKGLRMLVGARLSYKFYRFYGVETNTCGDCCANFIVYGAYTDYKGICPSFSINFGISLSFEGGDVKVL